MLNEITRSKVTKAGINKLGLGKIGSGQNLALVYWQRGVTSAAHKALMAKAGFGPHNNCRTTAQAAGHAWHVAKAMVKGKSVTVHTVILNPQATPVGRAARKLASKQVSK